VQFLDPNKGERLESSTGRVASRDMIQFAPMKDVHGMHVFSICMSFLKKDVLIRLSGKIIFGNIKRH
jgi:hypothetical protein